MTLTLIKDTFFDDFASSPAVGAGQVLCDGWIDIIGNKYSVSSIGKLSRNSGFVITYEDFPLARPTSENCLDQRIVMEIPAGGFASSITVSLALQLRWNGGTDSGNNSYLCKADTDTGDLIISSFVAGSETQLAAVTISGGINATRAYTLTFEATGGSPTTLSGSLFDVNTSTTVASISPFTDSTGSGLQAAGRFAAILPFENQTVTELKTYGTVLTTVIASDNITVGDNDNIAPLTIPPIVKSESITVSESDSVNLFLPAVTTDSVAVGEAVSILYTIAIPSTQSIAVGEAISLTPLSSPGISVSDNITVAEVVMVGTPHNMSLSANEAILMTDGSLVRYDVYLPSVESLVLSESLFVFAGFWIGLEIPMFDGISMTEALVIPPMLLRDIVQSDNMMVADTWNVSDNPLGAPTASDSLALLETVRVSQTFYVTKSESITVSAVPIVQTPLFVVEPPEATRIVINEGLGVVIVNPVTRLINVSSPITVASTASVSRSLNINRTESIQVSENPFQLPNIFWQLSVSDSIEVLEESHVNLLWIEDEVSWEDEDLLWGDPGGSGDPNPNVLVSKVRHVTDTITVSDSASASIIYCAVVNEFPIGVQDTFGLFGGYYSSVSDSCTVSDSAVATKILLIPLLTESTIVGDSLALSVMSFLAASDDLTVGETVSTTQVFIATTSESITVSESVSLTRILLMAIQDSLLVIDSVQNMLTLYIEGNDSLTAVDTPLARGVATQGQFEVTAGQITTA